MYKGYARFKSFFIVFLAVFSLCLTPALASGIQPYYLVTDHITCSFSLDGRSAACAGTCKPSSNDYTTSITVKLQKDDGRWTTIKTWNNTATNGNEAAAGGITNVSLNGSYRVVVSATITDPNGLVLERPSKTSSTRTN